jgi:hypothetical protein
MALVDEVICRSGGQGRVQLPGCAATLQPGFFMLNKTPGNPRWRALAMARFRLSSTCSSRTAAGSAATTPHCMSTISKAVSGMVFPLMINRPKA